MQRSKRSGPRGGSPLPEKSPSATPSANPSSLSGVPKFFTSVSTTLGLLFLLAAGSILGTLVPQSPPEDLTGFFPKVVFLLDLHTVYRSWWFILLLVLLAANLLGCLMERLPKLISEWKGETPRVLFTYSALEPAHISALETDLTRIGAEFLGVEPRKSGSQGARLLSWTKHKLYLLGFPFLHSAIIIILIGGLVGLVYGVRGHMFILEGQAETKYQLQTGGIRTLPFTVAVDRFIFEQYPNGAPKEFRSEVRILEAEKEVLKAPIRVNHPLTYKGISLYQSDYRPVDVRELIFAYIPEGGAQVEISIKPGEEAILPGTSLALKPRSLDSGGVGRGLGVEASLSGQGDPPKTVRLYEADPPVSIGPGKLKFVAAPELYATGLQVGYDPGAWLVWLGCSFLILGFLLILFTDYRTLVISLTPTKDHTQVKITGGSRKLRAEYRQEIETRFLPFLTSHKSGNS